jgi:hypothetical protein
MGQRVFIGVRRVGAADERRGYRYLGLLAKRRHGSNQQPAQQPNESGPRQDQQSPADWWNWCTNSGSNWVIAGLTRVGGHCRISMVDDSYREQTQRRDRMRLPRLVSSSTGSHDLASRLLHGYINVAVLLSLGAPACYRSATRRETYRVVYEQSLKLLRAVRGGSGRPRGWRWRDSTPNGRS